MFKLYYLVDQNGDIYGAKTLRGAYPTLAAAQVQAVSDGIAHYSVEETTGTDIQVCYVQ